ERPQRAAARSMKAPSGYRRAGGAVGVRNHLLVLPSVVCSTHVAGEIAAAADGVGVVHQHGCLQVGDDLQHSERLLTGVAANPNVGAVLVVSLGCETPGWRGGSARPARRSSWSASRPTAAPPRRSSTGARRRRGWAPSCSAAP